MVWAVGRPFRWVCRSLPLRQIARSGALTQATAAQNDECRSAVMRALSGPVHVGAVLNPKHGDRRGLVVDLVDDAICTASR